MAVVVFCISPAVASKTDSEALWRAFNAGEAFAIMRHAIAPGTGDPGHFKIGDCTSQRNLSERGRRQARRAGELFRLNGVRKATIFSSQWCRCRETAKLLAIGSVQDLPSLNSFFETYERRTEQTHKLRSWLQARANVEPLVLVTHQVNISALTGRGVSSGEILFVTPRPNGKYKVLGSIMP